MTCWTVYAHAQQSFASAPQWFGSRTCEAVSALSAPNGAAAIASAAAASKLRLRHSVSVQSASQRLGHSA